MTTATHGSRFSDIARKLGTDALPSAPPPHDAERPLRRPTTTPSSSEAQAVLGARCRAELGGGGATHAEICRLLRELAHYCGSTALALSMHTHLVAAAVWRHRHGQPGEALLRKIAASELVLVSTGAGDWVDSVGRAEARARRLPHQRRQALLQRLARRRSDDHQRAVRRPRARRGGAALPGPVERARASPCATTGTRSACAAPARIRSSSRTCSCRTRRSACAGRAGSGTRRGTWS